nr:hypothetical protein [Tanacetum cinerariifolium]
MVFECDGGRDDDVEMGVRMWRLLAKYSGRHAAVGVDDGIVVVRMMLAAGRWRRRVVTSGVVDRVDRVKGSIFGFGRKARRKSFPTAVVAGGGRLVAGNNGEKSICLGYHAIPPPYTRNFLPPKPDLSGLEEFLNEPIVSEPTVKKPMVETSEAKANTNKPKVISDSEDEDESRPKIEKNTVKPSFPNIEFDKSKEQVKSPRKTTVKRGNQNREIHNKIYRTKGVIDIGCSSGPNWLFDINALTKSINYKPVVAGNQSNVNVGTKACDDAGKAREETVHGKDYILLTLWTANLLISKESKSSQDDGFQPSSDDGKKFDEDPRQESECKDQEKENNDNNTNYVNVVGTNGVNVIGVNTNNELSFDPEMSELDDISTFTFSSEDEDDGAEADMNNLDTIIQVSPTPTIRIHKDHPLDQVIGDLHSTT